MKSLGSVAQRDIARPNRRTAYRTVAVLVALGLFAAACGDDSTGTPAGSTAASGGVGTAASAPTTAQQPKSGGTITYLHAFDPTGLDPAVGQVNGPHSMHYFAIYDALAIESTKDGSIKMRILETADTTDGQVWTLKLRSGVKFSDGTPLDATAVKTHWDRLKNPDTKAVNGAQARTVTSTEVVDAQTLKVTLAAPNGRFLRTIATSTMTFVPSPTAQKADPTGFNTKPVGAGAYTVKEWVARSQTVLVKNPTYYDKTYLDTINIKFIADDTQRLATLQSGGGDIARSVNTLNAKQAKDGGFANLTTSPSGGYVLFFNMSKPPFDNLKVRQAFTLAMDGKALSDAVYSGVRTPATNLFRDTSPYYDKALDQVAPSDQAAQKLFDEIAAANGGKTLEVTLSYVATFELEAKWYQAKLAGFKNVKVNLSLTDSTQFQQIYSSGNAEFGVFSYNITDPDGLTTYLSTTGPLNFSRYSQPDVDTLLTNGRATLNEASRAAIYKPLFQKINAELPFTVFVRQEAYEFFKADKVQGISLDNDITNSGALTLNNVWLK